jgi:hypothetical protein
VGQPHISRNTASALRGRLQLPNKIVEVQDTRGYWPKHDRSVNMQFEQSIGDLTLIEIHSSSGLIGMPLTIAFPALVGRVDTRKPCER